MSALLARIGGAAAARPWRVIAGWIGVLVVVGALALSVGGSTHDDYTIPGTSSQRGIELLQQRFPAVAGTDARVVVHDRSGNRLDPAVLAQVGDRLRTLHGVGVVAPVRLSADGATALISVQYSIPVTDFTGTKGVDALERAAAPASDRGLEVEYGGQVPENVRAVSGVAEAAGIVVAGVVLLVAFGSVVAAGLPLAVAFAGLGVGMGAILLLAGRTDVSTNAPTVASMVGIGVGIDYALLLVTRHVDGLRAGLPVREAAATATGTAGVSILFAGSTVVLALLGLIFSGLPVFQSFGYAASLAVAGVVAAALTLVPALCGLAGHRVLSKKERQGRARPPREPLTGRWAARVGRRPLPWALAALVIMLTLAAPVLAMRTWPQDAGSEPRSTTVRKAYDMVAASFGPGANGPFVIAVDRTKVDGPATDTLLKTIAGVPGVDQVGPAILSPKGDAAVAIVQSDYGPQDRRASTVLKQLRAHVLPAGVQVTGVTAVFSDIADLLAAKLWIVIGIVVAVSFVLLVLAFRSIAVPIKAAVMNLLSVGAAYGVLTAIFQWGWGIHLVGMDYPVAVSSWVPLLMFAVLFGLSMDYEVFLLSRVQEDYVVTGDPHGSVVRGLASTGRVISSAALIMVSVFVGFGLDGDETVKMIGVGMAVAVAVDATVVRMVLVPATMALLGRANWWLPGPLDRLLPHLDVHPSGPAVRVPAVSAPPAPVAPR